MREQKKGQGEISHRPQSVVASAVEWNQFHVKLWIESIGGGIPKNPELLDAHLRRKGLDEDKAKLVVDEAVLNQTPDEGIEEAKNLSWTTFLKDETGFYIPPCNIKAMLRDAFITLGTFVTNRGSKHQYQTALWVRPDKLYFMRDGKPITETHYREKAIHVMTARTFQNVTGRKT